MFDSAAFFPASLVERITATRVNHPEFAFRAAVARRCRTKLTSDGKLNLLAADHPARNVTKVGDNPLAMADRRDYLSRIVRVLINDQVDGIMATMDLLEDLLSLDGFLRAAGSSPLLDNKLLIASLNRGGLAGAAWEIDDPISGPSPTAIRQWRFDGAKLLMRIDEKDPASLKTILASAQAINECNALSMPMFLEPLPVTRTEKGYTVIKQAEPLAKLAGVASALGDSSRYLWLKLPYCPNYEIVARSTTLPILLLGGESAGDPKPFLQELASALQAGPNIRGALVGRNVLYPGTEDPFSMAEAVGGIVHKGWTVDQALATIKTKKGTDTIFPAAKGD